MVWPCWRVALLDVDLRAGLGQLLLDGLGVGLVHALLHGLGRAVDQVLRLLEAEVRDLADGLDDADLVGAGIRQDDRELGLLGRRSRSPTASSRSGTAAASDGNRRLDAPFFFQPIPGIS